MNVDEKIKEIEGTIKIIETCFAGAIENKNELLRVFKEKKKKLMEGK